MAITCIVCGDGIDKKQSGQFITRHSMEYVFVCNDLLCTELANKNTQLVSKENK